VEAGAPTGFDEAALAVFLRLGFFLGDDTPFQSIRTLPPDGTLTWEAGTVTISGGYRFVRPQRLSRDAAIDGFIDLFRQAMSRRPPAGQDVVVPLSGGRDSRHILLELCESGHRPSYTVTISTLSASPVRGRADCPAHRGRARCPARAPRPD
jgi:asparagine synthetase B (glutamine-hydrolysing)